MNKKFSKVIVVVSLLFVSSFTVILSQTDFSGIWIQDNSKTDDFYKSFNITLVIKQTAQNIEFNEIISSSSGEKLVERPFSCSLDGKEKTEQAQMGTAKKSAVWSPDRKTLTLTNITVNERETLGNYKTLSLSADKKVLTVDTKDANQLTGLQVKQVLNRK